jgi:hypothetical protein
MKGGSMIVAQVVTPGTAPVAVSITSKSKLPIRVRGSGLQSRAVSQAGETRAQRRK